VRSTKIIATLGPATEDDDVLRGLIGAGADVVRLNFSHGDHDSHRQQVSRVRSLAAQAGREVAIIGDLQGPKIRIRRFADGTVELREGQAFFLDTEYPSEQGTAEGVGVAYPQLPDDVGPGDVLLLDDGQIMLTVESISGTRINCRVAVGGPLADNKGINRRGGGLSAPVLTEKDLVDIVFAAEMELDWIAVSFVKGPDDMDQAREALRSAGGDGLMVAKIERAEAVDNLEAIISHSDAVMVARGDLGVEVGYAGLTGLQKRIIKRTRDLHKVAITATQMMESMLDHQSPTRAEVSDVANAVMDGTDAVMLSAETAVGKYPVKAVATMSEVCSGAETYHMTVGRTTHRMDDRFERIDEAIAMAAMYAANHLDVQAIIALTESGSTALWMSRIRTDIPVFAFTRHAATRRRVQLYRGVYPIDFDITDSHSQSLYEEMVGALIERKLVRSNDLVIFTKGDLEGVAGGTNALTIVRVNA
jgi:pyruvate kinase